MLASSRHFATLVELTIIVAVLLSEKLPSRPPRVYFSLKRLPTLLKRSQIDRIVLDLDDMRQNLLPYRQRRAAGWKISVVSEGFDLLCASSKNSSCDKATGHRWYTSWYEYRRCLVCDFLDVVQTAFARNKINSY